MIDDTIRRAYQAVLPTDDLGDMVDRAIAGDRASWDGLFDRFYPAVYRYAMARLGDPSAAEEAAQDVFVAAVGSLRTLRERRAPAVEAWFFRIARFTVADHIRRAMRHRRDLRAALDEPLDPGVLVADRLAAYQIREALAELTDDQRDVIVRRFVLDQPLDEVARVMGRRVGAIKSLQHRALAQLAKRLGRSMEH